MGATVLRAGTDVAEPLICEGSSAETVAEECALGGAESEDAATGELPKECEDKLESPSSGLRGLGVFGGDETGSWLGAPRGRTGRNESPRPRLDCCEVIGLPGVDDDDSDPRRAAGIDSGRDVSNVLSCEVSLVPLVSVDVFASASKSPFTSSISGRASRSTALSRSSGKLISAR